MIDALLDAGVRVGEEPGWKRRGRPGSFNPTGIVVHDDVIPRIVTRTGRVRIIRDGHGTLPGPLAHVSLLPDGTWHVVAAGRCNHAGKGGGVLGFKKGTDGNGHFYGVEVAHHPSDGDYPSEQIASLVRGCAALCVAHGWGAERVIHHREWAPGRKQDMQYRGPLREAVATQMRLLTEEDDVDPETKRKIDELWDALVGRRRAVHGDDRPHDLATPILDTNHVVLNELERK